mgnify:CR=1 FL=1
MQQDTLSIGFALFTIDKKGLYKIEGYKDIYALAKGKVSNEIGIYAIDKLNEEINK